MVHLNWNNERQKKKIINNFEFSKKANDNKRNNHNFKKSKLYLKNKRKINLYRKELMEVDFSKI